MRQQRIKEGQQRIQIVERRPPAARSKEERLFGFRDQVIEYIEVDSRRVSSCPRTVSSGRGACSVPAR